MEELASAYKLYCGAEADGCAVDTESHGLRDLFLFGEYESFSVNK